MLCLQRDPRPGGSNKTAPKSGNSTKIVKIFPKVWKTTANFNVFPFESNISSLVQIHPVLVLFFKCYIYMTASEFKIYITRHRIYYKVLSIWNLLKHDYQDEEAKFDLLSDWPNIFQRLVIWKFFSAGLFFARKRYRDWSVKPLWQCRAQVTTFTSGIIRRQSLDKNT